MENVNLLPDNLKIFFNRFSKAVEKLDKKELDKLISNQYISSNLLNKTKSQFIDYIIRQIPRIPLLTFRLDINVCQVNELPDKGYEVVIEPQYTYSIIGIGLQVRRGVFGIADTVSVILKINDDTRIYQIYEMHGITFVEDNN